MTKPRILFITPLPPPVHGSAMVSQYIKDYKEVQDYVKLCGYLFDIMTS